MCGKPQFNQSAEMKEGKTPDLWQKTLLLLICWHLTTSDVIMCFLKEDSSHSEEQEDLLLICASSVDDHVHTVSVIITELDDLVLCFNRSWMDGATKLWLIIATIVHRPLDSCLFLWSQPWSDEQRDKSGAQLLSKETQNSADWSTLVSMSLITNL